MDLIMEIYGKKAVASLGNDGGIWVRNNLLIPY